MMHFSIDYAKLKPKRLPILSIQGEQVLMTKAGFDNQKYLKLQSEHIRERIDQFGDKLYLEFGGKLFDD